MIKKIWRYYLCHLQQRMDYKEVQFFRRQIELNNYYGYFNLATII